MITIEVAGSDFGYVSGVALRGPRRTASTSFPTSLAGTATATAIATATRTDDGPDCRLPWRANSGGPSSRTRTEAIRSTLLGHGDGPIRCPRVERVGIDFGSRDPVACVAQWLKKAGFKSGEEARAALPLPPDPCICEVDPAPPPVPASRLSPAAGLYQALLLGLCTPFLYDPRRPILWTEASLGRRLLLYDGGGFYA